MDPKYIGKAWTGTQLLDITDPNPAQINLKDIARGLSRQYRFGGHTRDDLPAYSVAWHSLFCEQIADDMGLPIWARLQALLHDAPEYVLGDLIAPVKILVPAFSAYERKVWGAVARRFQIPPDVHPSIHDIDGLAFECERLHLIAPGAWDPAPVVPDPLQDTATAWFEFWQSRAAQEAAFAAALFHAKASALLDALADGEGQ